MEIGRKEVFPLDLWDQKFREHRVPKKRELGEPGLLGALASQVDEV